MSESAFPQELDALCAQILMRRERDAPARPEPLYHYTTADGLLGILRSNRLWATNAAYLNDSTEIAYGCDLVRECLAQKKAETEAPVLGEFLERASRSFEAFEYFDCFVTCFCEQGDLLSQWRGYGAAGGGYALGFTAKFLGMRTPLAKPCNFMLRRVVYDKSEQCRLIVEVLTELCDLLGRMTAGASVQESNTTIALFCAHLRLLLVEFLPCFKAEAFQEEREWRAIHLSTRFLRDYGQISFRTSGGSLIPYVELDMSPSVGNFLGKLPICEIVQGPTLHAQLNGAALHLLIGRYDYGGLTSITESRIPLRA